MMCISHPTVRPELVEGHLSGTQACGPLCFDKLSTNGEVQ